MAGGDANPNLNQNVWALAVFLGALGASEYWGLELLKWVTFFPAVVLTVLVLFSMYFYTRHYCRKKRLAWKRLLEPAPKRPPH